MPTNAPKASIDEYFQSDSETSTADLHDESNLDGWQSGLYYADRTPKPSLRGFRRAVADLRAGKLTNCPR